MRDFGKTKIQFVKGVGEKRARLLNENGIETLEDLIYLFPRRYLDRTSITPLKNARSGEEITIVGKVISTRIVEGRKKRLILLIGDGTGFLQCIWFQMISYWKKQFTVGELVSVSGKLTWFDGLQMTHPDFDKLGDGNDLNKLNTGTIVPQYPSTEALTSMGLHSRGIRQLIFNSLKDYGESIKESLPESLIEKRNLIPLRVALKSVHFPKTEDELKAAQLRLKFDELFFLEVALALRKKAFQMQTKGFSFKDVGQKTRDLIAGLEFELTDAQKRVLREIWADMKSSNPMSRLVQGDVGSGKTIVALITMLMVVENGFQAALMAPTEILAEQHFRNAEKMMATVGVKVVLLLGGQRKRERERIRQLIETGEADIVIGTHALIQGDVHYRKLGLAIVDEQHRFGVLQRAALQGKGEQPDVLVMTATPIPRTLSMTLYGDLDVSIIDELPAGRKPILTVKRSAAKRKEVYHYVRDELVQGAQAYIVFPLVEESEKIDLRAAQETYEKVKDGFFSDFEVGLLHGRLNSEEKEDVMARFKAKDIDLIIATTVIEVGVDVPNATIMVIEHAERFGLTQLHQLRGRVGRGVKESVCVLLYDAAISADGRIRLNTMCETNDGFLIAEKDLELRGPGEFFGTRQHGLPDLKIASLVSDGSILKEAREDAFHIVGDQRKLQETLRRAQNIRIFKRFQESMALAGVG